MDEDLLPPVSAQLGFNTYWGSPFYANALFSNGEWWVVLAFHACTVHLIQRGAVENAVSHRTVQAYDPNTHVPTTVLFL